MHKPAIGKPHQAQIAHAANENGHYRFKAEKKDWKAITKTKLNFDVDACPCCKTGKMIRILTFDAHAPPLQLIEQLKKQAIKK